MAPKKWEILSTKTDHTFRYFSLRIDRARSPRTGEAFDFYVLEAGTWVNIIPITPESNVVFVRQYRHGIREATLEIPGGVAEHNDSPEQAAVRELREETGYASDDIVCLGWVHPNPAIQNNRCYTYLARNAVPAGGLIQDDREDIEVVLFPLAQVPDMIRSGRINHALVIAAFQRYFLNYPPERKS